MQKSQKGKEKHQATETLLVVFKERPTLSIPQRNPILKVYIKRENAAQRNK